MFPIYVKNYCHNLAENYLNSTYGETSFRYGRGPRIGAKANLSTFTNWLIMNRLFVSLFFIKNGPCPATFYLISSFPQTVTSK